MKRKLLLLPFTCKNEFVFVDCPRVKRTQTDTKKKVACFALTLVYCVASTCFLAFVSAVRRMLTSTSLFYSHAENTQENWINYGIFAKVMFSFLFTSSTFFFGCYFKSWKKHRQRSYFFYLRIAVRAILGFIVWFILFFYFISLAFEQRHRSVVIRLLSVNFSVHKSEESRRKKMK